MKKIEVLKQICENESILIDLNEELKSIKENENIKNQKSIFDNFFENKDKEIVKCMVNCWLNIEKVELCNWVNYIYRKGINTTYRLIKEMVEHTVEGMTYSKEDNEYFESLQQQCISKHDKDFTFDYLSPIVLAFTQYGWCDLYAPIQNELSCFLEEYETEYKKLKGLYCGQDNKKESMKKETTILQKIKLYENFNEELKNELKNIVK